MVKEIPLQNGMVALVDDEDYERCMEYVWSVRAYGSSLAVGSEIGGKLTSLQSFIKEPKEGYKLTFLNKNKLDFRKSNITHRSLEYIKMNSKGKSGSSSKYKGVSWYKRSRKWVAEIQSSGNRKYLGSFLSEDDAARAYNSAALELWGEDCYLNVIGEENNAVEVTIEKTLFHRRKGTTSSFRGVYFCKIDRIWRSQFYFEGKQIHLGTFPTELEAARAYDKKAYEIHGDKAILNFPDEVDIS